VVEALLATAHAFLAERAAAGTPAWRLAELPDGPRRIASAVAATLGVSLTEGDIPEISRDGGTSSPAADVRPAVVGRLAQADGSAAAGAIVPLGRLAAVQIKVLRDAPRLVLTASREVVIPDLSPEAAGAWLAAMTCAGLAVEADSRWSGVTACAGRPGCAKSLADVRGDALAVTRFGEGLPVHWVGCGRGCGSPSGPHVRVEATPEGYAVSRTGGPADHDTSTHRRLAEIIATARRS
jgi:precorrin-3B synthase